jgi:hypothetical protein
MLNTKTGDLYNNNDVINSNDLRKRLINVDSRFRPTLTEPVGNFLYRLEHTYKNVIRVRVASIEIPNTFYTFTTARQNVSFVVTTKDLGGITRSLTILIADGNYTISELITEIQDQLNAGLRNPYGIYINIALDVNSGKITIACQGLIAVWSSGALPNYENYPVTFDFSTPRPSTRHGGIGIGYNLGFRQAIYVPNPNAIAAGPSATPTSYPLTGEAIVDTVEDTYLLLGLNDLHTLEHRTTSNYFQMMGKIIVREDKNAIIYDDGSSLVTNQIIFPSPQNLTNLQISLLDAYGEIIDLNGLNYSVTFEITEVLNTRLYDFYRNYIWSGGVPITKNKGAGAAGMLTGAGPPF